MNNLLADKEMNTYSSFIDWQRRAKKSFSIMSKPTRKEEAWRYSDLDLLNKELIGNQIEIKEKLNLSDTLEGSITLPEGVSVTGSNDKEFVTHINNFFQGSKFDLEYQVMQNYASCTEGFYICFAKSCEYPVELKISSTGAKNILLLIEVKDNVQVEIAENFISKNFGHLNLVSKIILGANTKVRHSKLHNFSHPTYFLYSSHIIAKRNAIYKKLSVNLNCTSHREFVNIDLVERSSEVVLLGINYGQHTEKNDTILVHNHLANCSKSLQKYFYILKDRAKSSFYGRVIVPKGLAELVAHQLNKNILLNEGCSAFSRPELDILSKDIQCSHGSTVGGVDKEALYYMQNRCLNLQDAKTLLILATLDIVSSEFDCHHFLMNKIQTFMQKNIVL
jgi:hypothetical protein